MNVNSEIIQVPIEDIIPNRFQPRLNFDDKALQELANSIKQHGIIQPLVLRKLGDKYEIIAGERRYKASQITKNIWADTVENTLKNKDVSWYETPDNVIGVALNAVSGEATNDTSKAAIFYYVKGSENYVFKEE